MKTLIISNDEIRDIIKIVNSLEDSGILFKGVTEEFLGMFQVYQAQVYQEIF